MRCRKYKPRRLAKKPTGKAKERLEAITLGVIGSLIATAITDLVRFLTE